MSVKDIIKKSVLEGFNSGDLSAATIQATLLMAIGIGLFIYIVYRISTRNGFYNRGFNKSLAAMPVITAGIMLAMQSNLIISLGMVGALSIVRFRNAVKDSVDLTYLFWSISMGIIVGAGLFQLAVVISLCMTVLMLVLDLIPTFRAPSVLVISAEKDADEKAVMENVKKFSHCAKVRSRNITKRGTEWIMEVRVRKAAELVQEISAMENITSVNLLNHDGEVRF